MTTPEPPPIAEDRNLFTALQGPATPGRILEALLKQPGRAAWELLDGRTTKFMLVLGSAALIALAIYGLVAGSLTGGLQLWIAPTKIVIGSVLSAAICLPSLYVFLCLNGANAGFLETAGLLIASVALTAILLVSLVPIAWVFSQSTDSLAGMGFLHLVLWATAATFGLRFLSQSASHASMSRLRLGAWIVIYILVSLQMTTALRPILGRSDHFLPQEKKFFFAHWMETLTTSP